MQTIQRYPIHPSSTGVTVEVPEGSQLLSVSLNIHTYYLHVLVKGNIGLITERRIIARQDDTTYEDRDLGQYLGRCEQPGDQRGWHFFAAPLVGAKNTGDDHVRIINESLKYGGAQ